MHRILHLFGDLMLPPDEAHVWFTRTARISPELRAAYRRLLCEEERARADSFVFAEHCDTFVIAHALVRCALSQYASVHPATWRFAVAAHGRPRIAAPAAPLDFNLSHTDGLCVCLVSRGPGGVDAEHLGRPAPLGLAATCFAPAERQALATLPNTEQARRFYELWTLKEAYLKARGVGLAIPLDRFCFALASDRTARVEFAPPIDDDPCRWRFALLEPTPDHQVAVALADVASTRVIVRELVPLAG